MAGWSSQLIHWYESNKRDLPWRNTRNPYFIWLSEVILQQTRVQQGLPYYERFVSTFPTIECLAKAPLTEVLNCWQGLGYYSRARNLHAAAQQVVELHQGHFPSQYVQILGLKGVGPYTAAAIASFAFDLPHAVVDGNVYRVLSRHFGLHEPIDSSEGQRMYAQLAQQLLNKKQPALHNQAIMEFGAIQCIPVNPDCERCVFQASCAAYARQEVSILPIKVGKVKQSQRFFNYLVFQSAQGLYLQERTGKDIWQNLWEFALEESDKLLEREEIMTLLQQKFSLSPDSYRIKQVSEPHKHILTHQRLFARFWLVQIFSNLQSKELIFVPYNQLGSKPLPRLIDKFIKTHPTWLD